MQETNLRILVKTYFDSQKFRIRTNNRMVHVPNINLTESPIDDLLLNDVLESKDKQEEEKVFIVDEYRKKAKQQRAKAKQSPSTNGFGDVCKRVSDGYTAIEKDIVKEIEIELLRYPISKWLLAQRGIGPVIAGALIAYTGDISKCNHVTSLWQKAGMGMVTRCDNCGKRVFPNGGAGRYIENMTRRRMEINAKSKDKSKVKSQEEIEEIVKSSICTCGKCRPRNVVQKQVAGELADYNPDFKKLCFLISDQFVKQTGSFYNLLYKQYYNDYLFRPDLQEESNKKKGRAVKGVETKGTAHINAMARRKAVKMFLSHMWEEWRTLEGLPTPNPYILEHGHVDKVERPRIEYR